MNDYSSNNSQESIKQKIIAGIAKISLALKSKSWQNAGLQGLTPTQGQILALFSTRSVPEMRLSEVAKAIAITSATASAAIAIMVEKNLIEKRKARDDGRAITITLTPEGKRKAKQVSGWNKFLLDAIDRLSFSEQKVFFSILLKTIQILQQKNQIPVSKMCITCRFFQPNTYSNSQYPHHCYFINTPFSDDNIRLECPDHFLAKSETIKLNCLELYQSDFEK